MARTRMFGKNTRRGITWKLRKAGQPFMSSIRLPDLIHIPIKLHEAISNGH